MTKRASPSLTLRDVGRAAGVDASTVSLALRGHPRIPAATRDRIRRAAEALGYHSDPALGMLAARRWLGKRSLETTTLAYIAQHPYPLGASNWRDSYLVGVLDRATQLGYRLDILDPRHYPEDNRLSDVIYSRGIRGVIVGQRTVLGREHHLAWQRFCVVQAGLNFPTDVLTLVRGDLDAALRQSYEHLRAAGYRRILIYLAIDAGAASDRILLESVKHLPVSRPGANWTVLVDTWDSFHDQQPAVLARIRTWKPDAVLTMHPGQVEIWRSAGVEIPAEYAVACLHLDAKPSEVAGMNLQMEQVGALAVDLVDIKLRRFEYGRPSSRLTIMVEPVWVPGASLPEPARHNPHLGRRQKAEGRR